MDYNLDIEKFCANLYIGLFVDLWHY